MTRRRNAWTLLRLAVLSAIVLFALLGTPPASAASIQAPPASSTPQTPPTSVAAPSSTSTSVPEVPGEDTGPGSTTTSVPQVPGEVVVPDSTTTSVPAAIPHATNEPQQTTTSMTPSTVALPAAPFRPSASPKVRDSHIPLGSIALSLFVLAGVGVVAYRLFRHRPALPVPPGPVETPPLTGPDTEAMPARVTLSGDASTAPSNPARAAVDASTSQFLIGLGEALMDAGAAVSHVESALRGVARSIGTGRVGVLVLPTALIVSVPHGDDLVTQIGAPGRVPLRLDQIDDLLALVREAESGAIGATEGMRRLAEIRAAAAPYPPRLVLAGHVCATVGLAAILYATWVEVLLAGVLGAIVGMFRLWTRRLTSSYQPFVVLIAATAVSTSVFALTRVRGDLLTFPLLIAPLTTFLPGGLLTIAVLELATGQIVSGASRLASGGLQLILLALGIVAGAQLVGVPAGEIANTTNATVAVFTPWIGVAVFGIGLVWFYGARSSARPWILLVMYVAYAGQVIGGLFFGSALSAFFGALALTPVAVLAARRSSAPSPLVTILPGFWLLVPGALGLDGVTRLFGSGGGAATGILLTTVTSMVGVSLGILLGLLLVASDPERPWSEIGVVEPGG